nr:retrovirus-related Pol polyprotein from transposon TNT 1-94 [Tanacetum cinerariifolium]
MPMLVGNKNAQGIPTASDEFPLPEDFPTASEERFPLLRTVAVTTEDMQKRRNDVKARTTLLLALPDKHQLRFSKYKTAQELWAAILKTFGGNEATKMTKKNQLKQQYGNFKAEGSETLEQTFNRLQAIVSHLEFMDKEIKQDNLNQKFLTSLAPEWLMYTIVWRNKTDLDTMSLDDVYNHLKVYEPKVQKKSESNSQNMAFISSAKNNSRNGEVNTAGIPTVSTQVSPTSANVSTASISLDTACTYIASQYSCSQIKYEDINQIDEDDIKEMDIKSQDRGRRENFKQVSKVEESAPKDLMAIDGVGCDWSYMTNEEEDHALVADQEAPTEFTLMAKSSYDTENKEGLGYSVVPPFAQVYSPPKKDMSWTGLPEFADDTITDYSRPSSSIERNKGKAIKASACWIWKPKQNLTNKGPNSNSVSVMFKKYTYIDTQGRLNGFSRYMTGNLSNLSDYEPYDGGYVSFGQEGCKITGKGTIKTDESELWHKRLGHLNFKTMNRLVRHNLVKGLPSKCFDNEHTFVACLKGKQHKASCKTKLVHSMTKPLHTLHMDLFGPTSAEAVNTACYVQNRVLVNMSQNKTPYELFNGRTPAIGFLKLFGCHVMILNTLDHLGKFKAKGDEGYFIGYSMSSKAFRVFNKRTNRVEENLHVDFLENKLIKKGAGPNWLFDIDTLTNSMNYVPVVSVGTNSTNFSGTKDAASQDVKKDVSSLRYIALLNWFHEAHLESSTSNSQDACKADAPESSGNSNPTPTSTNPPVDQMETLTVETPIPTFFLFSCFLSQEEPKKISDALKDPRPIGTKWVLKNKKDERGIVIKNKARLVAQGHTQEDGIDYEEVFAPVVRIEAIRLFLAYAFFMGFTVYQMDVNSAFLYGTIDEEVYGKDRTGKDVDLHLYRSMIGSLMYLTASSPDIVFAVCACARHQVTPKECHLHAVKKIFKYLKGHPKLGVWYPKDSPFDLLAYSDSDYGGATQDRKSTTGGCQFLGRRLISWQCKKQTIVATSTTEAEYVAAASGYGQASHLRYALTINPTIYVSHIRQFWSTVRVETTDEGTKILTTIDGKTRTIFESSIRRNLKLRDEAGIGSLPDAELFKNLTLMGTVPLFDTMLVHQGKGSGTPTEPHHTPSPKAPQSSQRDLLSSIHPHVTTLTISTVIPTDTPLRQYTRRARIAQSLALPTIADEPASPLGDDSQELMDLCTRLQRQQNEMVSKITAQDLEISTLKARIKLLEDRDGGGDDPSRENATIKGRSLETGEEAGIERSTDKGSNDTEEMVNVLTSLDAASILTSGVQVSVPPAAEVATVSIPPAGEIPTVSVPTGSGVVATASPIFTTATVATPYSKRKGKEKMVESETPKKKKLQEQMDMQMARLLEEEMGRDAQGMNEQIARDAEIARIHAKEELQMLIDSLDRKNETIAKYLQEYE